MKGRANRFRRAIRLARLVPAFLLTGLTVFYRRVISPILPPSCRYYPTCSAYMTEAVRRHGALKGLYLGLGRVLRCHPYCRCGFHDPVPKEFAWRDIFRYKRRA